MVSKKNTATTIYTIDNEKLINKLSAIQIKIAIFHQFVRLKIILE